MLLHCPGENPNSYPEPRWHSEAFGGCSALKPEELPKLGASKTQGSGRMEDKMETIIFIGYIGVWLMLGYWKRKWKPSSTGPMWTGIHGRR